MSLPSDPKTPGAELFTLRLPNQPYSVRFALASLAAALDELGFATADAKKFAMAVGEACTNVLKHAYRPGETETYDVICSIEFGKLKVRVRDHGLPYDPFHLSHYDPEHPDGKGMGTFLMKHLAHEVRYLNLGREGKAFDLYYTLPGGWHAAPNPALAAADDDATSANPGTLTVRPFHPDDAGQVARCAYRAYGYSYFGEHLYIPERLIEMNKRGDITSAVVADDGGRIFGHLALVFGPDRDIPEEGQAFIMPQARGGGWFKKLKGFLYDVAGQRGLPGVFSEGVTVHPFTQRANRSLGARECGLMLAFVPGSIQFKQISDADDHRHSLVVFYKPLVPGQTSRPHIPARHAAMIREIYANVGVSLVEPDPQSAPAAGPAHVDVICNALLGIAYLTVRRYGDDLIDQLRLHRQQLCCHGIAVLQLDLPMNDPGIHHATEAVEDLGFFFVAVIPHFFGTTSALRFQYLNNVEVSTQSLVLDSDFARRLLAYILTGVKD